MNTGQIILEQLGGNKFIVMTGSKNFITSEITETVKDPYLEMTLTRNIAKVNRLKISLTADDLYTMHFYKIRLNKEYYPVLSNQIIRKGIYNDQLQAVFTEITGLHTKLF